MKKVYIGTYTSNLINRKNTGSKGIYVCNLDETTGKLKTVGTATESDNPSFLAISPTNRTLVACNEKIHDGAVDSYEIQEDGLLVFTNRKPINSIACCHVGYSFNGKFITAANYGNGSILTISINENGELQNIVSDIQFYGTGANKSRRECPHAHSVVMIEKFKLAISCDLGTDKLMLFNYNENGVFSPCKIPFVETPPGSGPRHIAVSHDSRFIYVTAELSNEVLVFEFIHEKPMLKQWLSTLPEEYNGENFAADIHLDKSGQNLYISNRGHNSIAHYYVNIDGTLWMRKTVPCHGCIPRSFALTDRFVICANQDSNRITVLNLKKDGRVGEIIDELEIPSPTCVLL